MISSKPAAANSAVDVNIQVFSSIAISILELWNPTNSFALLYWYKFCECIWCLYITETWNILLNISMWNNNLPFYVHNTNCKKSWIIFSGLTFFFGTIYYTYNLYQNLRFSRWSNLTPNQSYIIYPWILSRTKYSLREQGLKKTLKFVVVLP